MSDEQKPETPIETVVSEKLQTKEAPKGALTGDAPVMKKTAAKKPEPAVDPVQEEVQQAPAAEPAADTQSTPEPEPAAPAPAQQVPSVGRVVHYGLPGLKEPLAAIITAVPENGDPEAALSLVVFREHLQFFRRRVPFAAELTAGSWSWPARV